MENNNGPKFVCEFGHRHDIARLCDCFDRYKVFPGVFTMKLRELYGQPGVPLYSANITDEMRLETLNICPRVGVKDKKTVATL